MELETLFNQLLDTDVTDTENIQTYLQILVQSTDPRLAFYLYNLQKSPHQEQVNAFFERELQKNNAIIEEQTASISKTSEELARLKSESHEREQAQRFLVLAELSMPEMPLTEFIDRVELIYKELSASLPHKDTEDFTIGTDIAQDVQLLFEWIKQKQENLLMKSSLDEKIEDLLLNFKLKHPNQD